MNAIEFVKNYGVEEAIKVVDLHPVSTLINIDGCCVSVLDLKQIVDAFELIDSYDGLSEANNWINNIISNGGMTNIQAANCELQKAINLVEKCQ